jgi:hypothetical protein
MIPIQKQHFGLGQSRPVTEEPNEIIPSAEDLLDEGGFSVGPSFDTLDFINDSTTAVGGNSGFWRALQVSLLDPGDENRPQFPPNFAVGGVCIIFGADSFKDLQRNFRLFEQVFAMGNRATLSGNTRPVVQNVRTRAVPMSAPFPARIGVQIDWDPVPLLIGFPLYSNQTILPTEIFVVRSTDIRFREKRSWGQAFNREPQDSQSDLQEEGATRVIARITNDGFVTRFIDNDDDSLEENVVYFYGVALRFTIDDEVQPMGEFSNVLRTHYRRRPTGTRRSVMPDWWATPSLIALFPELEGLINIIRLEIANLGSRTLSNNGASQVIDQTISQLELLIAQGEALLAAINDTAGKILALDGSQLAATSSTVFSVETGGMERWMGDLSARFSDRSDPTRPPFDDNELVAGIVIVAGAPNLPNLQPFLDLLALFFGSAEDNPILDAISAVEEAARAAEDIVFDEGMVPGRTTTAAPATAPLTQFDPSMNPTNTIACD